MRVLSVRNTMARTGSFPIQNWKLKAHASEYVASCDERRLFVSNFSGSAGIALVETDSM